VSKVGLACEALYVKFQGIKVPKLSSAIEHVSSADRRCSRVVVHLLSEPGDGVRRATRISWLLGKVSPNIAETDSQGEVIGHVEMNVGFVQPGWVGTIGWVVADV